MPSSPSASPTTPGAESGRARPEMLIDTHLHLDAAEFDPDRQTVIEAARQAGVGAFVLPAVERANFDTVASLAARHTDVGYALGIHPLYVGRASESDLDVLDAALASPCVLAVGEIGLDRYVDQPAFELQLHFFQAQLQLAARHRLPVLLHVRRAVDEILKALRRCPVPGGIAHAFNGSRQQAEMFIGLGFKLGFGGAMTHPGSTRIRELAETLPWSALVLETDAPDIAPVWARGQRNEPANLARIAGVLAELRGVTVAEVARHTSDNARQVLPRLARLDVDPGGSVPV